VVTQASGFDGWLPVGRGLFCFETVEQAAAALRSVEQDYPGHCRAARDIAERYFDSRLVLSALLKSVL
jgi:hypothetical protein